MFINNNVGKKGDIKIKALFRDILRQQKVLPLEKKTVLYFQAQHKDCSRI